MSNSNLSDFAAVFDTFVPLIVSLSSYMPLFQAAVKTICFFGGLLEERSGGTDACKRLSSCRDYLPLIRLTCLKSMDKIPYLANIIHSFLGSNASDADNVRVFLDLKNLISCDSQTTQLVRKTSGTEYLLFLAAFNVIECQHLHSESKQLTVFHLSECLSVINTYKTSNERRSLLVAEEAEKNSSCAVISTFDIPSLEVSAVLHILASILRSKVSLQLKVLADVVCSALRIFIKIVLHANCPSNIRKAYTAVLLELFQAGDAILELRIKKDILTSAALMLLRFKGDVLRDGILWVAKTSVGDASPDYETSTYAMHPVYVGDAVTIQSRSFEAFRVWQIHWYVLGPTISIRSRVHNITRVMVLLRCCNGYLLFTYSRYFMSSGV